MRLFPLALIASCLLFFVHGSRAEEPPRVLIFTKMTGYVHKMTPDSAKNLRSLFEGNHIAVDDTDDSGRFTQAGLKPYCALVFLNNSGVLFTPEQRTALVDYIHAGGGFVGLHAASTAEGSWDWYQQLLGAKFSTHPWVQKATLTVLHPSHPAVQGLPATWTRSDEWYTFRGEPKQVIPLLMVGETRWHGDGVLETGTRGGAVPAAGDPASIVPPHVIAWCHEFEGGRAFYSAMGHFAEAFLEPEMQAQVLAAVRWAGRLQEKADPVISSNH